MTHQRQILRSCFAINLLGIGLTTATVFGQTGGQSTAPTSQPAVVTSINIHMQQAVAEDVFAELTKQSGVKFAPNGNLWDQDAMQTPIDIDIDNKPFWSAVKSICSLTGISMQPQFYMGQGNGKRIMIQHFEGQHDSMDKYPSVETPSVMVQARNFSRQQSVDYGEGRNSQNWCSIELMAYVDPALHVQSLNPNARPEIAIDDAGNSMIPGKNGGPNFGGQQQKSLIYSIHVPLKYPDHPGKKIADLKCNLLLKVGDKMDSLTVEKPLEATDQSKSFGDMTITFNGLKKTGGSMYECKLSIASDDNEVTNNAWNMLQNAQLQDAKGHAFTYAGGGGGGGGNGVYTYTVNYNSNGNGNGDDQPAEPAKWMLELPSQTHQMKIPVEFKDLAIPQ